MSKQVMHAIGLIVLLLLAIGSIHAQPALASPSNPAPPAAAPLGLAGGVANLLPEQAYVIELKYLSPDRAIEILQNDQFKQFLPKDITALIGIPHTQKLLIQTPSAATAIRLTQLISLIDQPDRLALQVMLIIVAPPQPGGARQPMPTADGNTPLAQTAVQTWVQSLIDTCRGSVILFPDQPVVNNQGVILQAPPFLTNIPSIIITDITPNQSNIGLMFRMLAGQKLAARLSVFSGNVKITGAGLPGGTAPFRVTASKVRSILITMVIGQTRLVPIEETTPEADTAPPTLEGTGKRYFLAITPKVIPPSIPALGIVPTTDGSFVIRGDVTLQNLVIPPGTPLIGGPAPAPGN